MYSTNLSFTGSWYKYVQIFISQEAGTNMNNSFSQSELVQICTNLYLTRNGTNMYNSISHSELVQVCTVQISFTRNWHKYVQISISQEVGTNVYKSHSHRMPVKICTNLSLSLEIEIVYACSAPLAHADTPPPPHWWLAGRCCGQLHISPEMFEFPPPPPRCCRLNLRVWLAVGGGGEGGG